jgi:tetratricopeptide (TPR) repeat protein
MAKAGSTWHCALGVSVLCALALSSALALANSAGGKALPPSEAQVRFQQGLKLSASNQSDAAIKVFSQLTVDYPLLLQPYLQLAALYVRQGKLPRAASELRTALEHQLDDGTLQESLGDLYIELAKQSYRGAMDAANPGPGAADKYATLQKLNGSTASKGTVRP